MAFFSGIRAKITWAQVNVAHNAPDVQIIIRTEHCVYLNIESNKSDMLLALGAFEYAPNCQYHINSIQYVFSEWCDHLARIRSL